MGAYPRFIFHTYIEAAILIPWNEVHGHLPRVGAYPGHYHPFKLINPFWQNLHTCINHKIMQDSNKPSLEEKTKFFKSREIWEWLYRGLQVETGLGVGNLSYHISRSSIVANYVCMSSWLAVPRPIHKPLPCCCVVEWVNRQCFSCAIIKVTKTVSLYSGSDMSDRCPSLIYSPEKEIKQGPLKILWAER